jgi:hypothetical protein
VSNLVSLLDLTTAKDSPPLGLELVLSLLSHKALARLLAHTIVSSYTQTGQIENAGAWKSPEGNNERTSSSSLIYKSEAERNSNFRQNPTIVASLRTAFIFLQSH